jgi:selenocysteine lyase/cysteine desulfurase
MDAIHTRVTCLAGWLLGQLRALRHANGRPAVRLYGPPDTAGRGATIAMNFTDADGELWDCHAVERLASERGISLRAGCHCNPGAREAALGFTAEELASCFDDRDRMNPDAFMARIEGKMAGAVRVSLGLVSTFADVHAFMCFARALLERPALSLPAAAHLASA